MSETNDGLEMLQGRNRYEVTLPGSGWTATIRLPRVRDAILAGDIPLAVLEHMARLAKARPQEEGDPGQIATTEETDEELSAEERRHIARFQDEIVCRTVVALQGQPVQLSLEAVAELDQADYDALVAWGSRAEPIPKAGASE